MYTNGQETCLRYREMKSERSNTLGQSSILKEQGIYPRKTLRSLYDISPVFLPCESMRTIIVSTASWTTAARMQLAQVSLMESI